jgi:SAM-dependent methyltransferase
MQEQVYHANFKQENEYFWFIARNKIVYEKFLDYCQLPEGSNVIDIGCGTGGFASKLATRYTVTGTDTEPLALEYSQKRGLSDLHLGTLDDFSSDKQFQAAFMLDVIEHIEDDNKVVSQVYDLLPSDGWFVASVPAYQWMWSKHDEIHQHFRRYDMKRFTGLLKNAGFSIEYSSYFNTLLFPAAIAKRAVDAIVKPKDDSPHDEVSPGLNNIFTKIFSSESNILKKASLPFGLSIMVIARKP